MKRKRQQVKESGNRLNLMLPADLYRNVIELGATLGYNSAASAGRYFLTLGVQASMSAIGSLRQQKSTETITDMFGEMLRLAESEASREEPRGGVSRERVPAPSRSRKKGH